jgi:hypothetical protein
LLINWGWFSFFSPVGSKPIEKQIEKKGESKTERDC